MGRGKVKCNIYYPSCCGAVQLALAFWRFWRRMISLEILASRVIQRYMYNEPGIVLSLSGTIRVIKPGEGEGERWNVCLRGNNGSSQVLVPGCFFFKTCRNISSETHSRPVSRK